MTSPLGGELQSEIMLPVDAEESPPSFKDRLLFLGPRNEDLFVDEGSSH